MNTKKTKSATSRPAQVRQYALIVLAVASVVVFLVAYLRHRRETEPLEPVAKKLFDAIETRDIDTLYGYMYDAEKELLGLSKSELGSYYDWAFAGFDFGAKSDGVVADLGRRDSLYIARKSYTLKDGNVVLISIDVVRTPDGPKFNLTAGFFASGMQVKYGRAHMGQSVPYWSNVIKGLPQERAKLEAIGLKGIYQQKQTVKTWDQVLEFSKWAFAQSEDKEQ